MRSWLKQWLCLIVGCVILSVPTNQVLAATDIETNNALFEEISLQETSTFWEMIQRDYGNYLPEINNLTLREFLQKQEVLSVNDWLSAIFTYIGFEVVSNGKLLGTLIVLSLCSLIFRMIQNTFESSTISKVSDLVVMLVLLILAVQSFRIAATYVTNTVSQMQDFMVALLPLILGLMASFGSITAVAFFHPIIVSFIHLTVLLLSNVLIPLFFISAILQIVSVLNEAFQLTKLAELLKNIGLALLGVTLTIFLSIVSVQGVASAVQDGVAMKTTKFITGNFIPVVGKMFTDATDTVLNASLLLKNAVGIAGMIIICIIVIFPAIKVIIISFMYKLTVAILQPLGDGPILKCLDIISKHILYLFATLLIVSLMFFLLIVIIVVASNITLMLR